MSNHSWMTLALIVIGVVGVNFFYLSDLLAGGNSIQLGMKSLIAVGGANALAISGVSMLVRGR